MMRYFSILIQLLLAMLVALQLISCGGPQPVHSVETLPAGKGVVFGKISVIQSHHHHKFGTLDEDKVLVLPADSSEATLYQLNKDGSFYWDLKPGDYMVLGMPVIGAEGEGIHQNRIGVTFNVPGGARSTYVGDMQLVSKTSVHYVLIKDEHDTAFAALRKRFTQAAPPVTSLMQLEEKVGSYQRLMYICSGEWGVVCTNDYRGVTPLAPALTPEGFTPVDSLQPVFKWASSGDDDVSYDLVIYEAASVKGDGKDKQYMPGRLALYQEDIKNPQFSLTRPLQAGTNYYWSVRLRRHNVVSNWSTFGHYNFIVVGLTLAEGEWFEFSTPPQ